MALSAYPTDSKDVARGPIADWKTVKTGQVVAGLELDPMLPGEQNGAHDTVDDVRLDCPVGLTTTLGAVHPDNVGRTWWS